MHWKVCCLTCYIFSWNFRMHSNVFNDNNIASMSCTTVIFPFRLTPLSNSLPIFCFLNERFWKFVKVCWYVHVPLHICLYISNIMATLLATTLSWKYFFVHGFLPTMGKQFKSIVSRALCAVIYKRFVKDPSATLLCPVSIFFSRAAKQRKFSLCAGTHPE